MRLLLAMAALALCTAPLHASEEKSEPLSIGSGIICDTPEQALRLVALRNEGSELVHAVSLVNREAANPNACGQSIVAARVLEELHSRRMGSRRVVVTKIVVKAISDGRRWVPVPDRVQYALVALNGVEV